jgi:uncharacterized glyoxalase superfamily metalloenzyme YdcJ
MPQTFAQTFADPIDMQNRLFAELSRMFGREVPLYDRSLAVNRVCNTAVCELLGKRHLGFRVSADEIERASGERHGAIRIGRADEYRWIGRFFGCFAMEPHNFYDMTNVGAKSQPIIATAFRSAIHPDHRIFTSLLMTDYFDAATKARIDALLAGRQVFSQRAKELIERRERQGGLDPADADALIAEGVNRIFKWTGKARDHELYTALGKAGFKIAADIACFESHHLNHLTPNTLCMDLYTAAMKHCLGETDAERFRARAALSLDRLARAADRDWMALHFKHVPASHFDQFRPGAPSPAEIAALIDGLVTILGQPEFDLRRLPHAGFKDLTEGPSEDTPILLRQDAYKALTEPVTFANPDGTTTNTTHTARFGEIEQRFYAVTAEGRTRYDRCLAAAESERERDPGLPKRDVEAFEAHYARHFAEFPKTLPALLAGKLVYGSFLPTAQGLAAAGKGSIQTTDLWELIRHGFVAFEGMRYEDFLPVSAAGIFASNLNQYGTKSTAAVRPTYTQATLEEILGRPIIDAEEAYRGMEAESLWTTYSRLGLLERLPIAEREGLERAKASAPRVARSAALPPQHAGV